MYLRFEDLSGNGFMGGQFIEIIESRDSSFVSLKELSEIKDDISRIVERHVETFPGPDEDGIPENIIESRKYFYAFKNFNELCTQIKLEELKNISKMKCFRIVQIKVKEEGAIKIGGRQILFLQDKVEKIDVTDKIIKMMESMENEN